MFKVNTRDGRTRSFDQHSNGDMEELECLLMSKDHVTGLSIHLFGVSFVFPSETISESDSIGVQLVNHRDSGRLIALQVWAHTKDLRTSMTVFCGTKSRMCRTDVHRLGYKAGM